MSNTPKNFVIQLASLITLYVSVSAFLTLIFSLINSAIPDAAASQWDIESNQVALKASFAILIVFFPTYLVTTRWVNHIRRETKEAYTTVTRWLIYLSLLVGGIIMLIDLVVVIQTFLEGELTVRFIAKALSLLIVIGAVFYYYLLDARGYWVQYEQHSIMYAAIGAAVVMGMMLASLYHIESPHEARERKLDEQQIDHLINMHYHLEDYYLQVGELPEGISEAFPANNVPVAPHERPAYQYEKLSDTRYQLCATFTYGSAEQTAYRPYRDEAHWDHQAGEWCFERTVVQKQPETPLRELEL